MNAPVENAPPSFELNRPTIVSLLYLASFAVGITSLIGVILAYAWKKDDTPAWEASHYLYLIHTFWIAVIGVALCVVLMTVFIGFLLLAPLAALVIVRCVLSLAKAQKRQPMPNADSWFV